MRYNSSLILINMPRKRKCDDDVDRLGAWYTTPKAKRVTPVDRVTAIMAPRLDVTGSRAVDKTVAKVQKDCAPAGNRKFSRKQYRPQVPGEQVIAEEREGSGVVMSNKTMRLLSKMPKESKVNNHSGTGVIHSIPDIKLDPALAQIVAMTKGGSPLDEHNPVSLSDLHDKHRNLIKNYKSKLPGLNPRRKITKGGRTFVSFKNILVTPDAAP